MAHLVKNLKVMLLNAENLFLLSDSKLTPEHLKLDESSWQKLSTSVYENKSLYKLNELSKIIRQIDPDILMLAEVGGLESLNNFNRLFLNETYSPALTEGNSDRHIDIGYFIRKEIGFYFDLVSNKNRPLNFWYAHEQSNDPNHEKKPSQKFSRDVAELHLFTRDREKPFLIFMMAHLKSRLDHDNIDANGFARRQAELNTYLEIYQELEARYQYKIPIIVAGDFNGNASHRQTDPEFKSLYEKTSLKDVCELAGLDEEKSATYYQVGRNSRTEGRQIDYAFLNPVSQNLLDQKSVHIFRYQDPRGLPLDPPATLDAKLQLPSDHYPLVFELVQVPVF